MIENYVKGDFRLESTLSYVNFIFYKDEKCVNIIIMIWYLISSSNVWDMKDGICFGENKHFHPKVKNYQFIYKWYILISVQKFNFFRLNLKQMINF